MHYFSYSVDNTDVKITNGNIEDTESEHVRLRKEVTEMKKAKQQAEDQAHKWDLTFLSGSTDNPYLYSNLRMYLFIYIYSTHRIVAEWKEIYKGITYCFVL